MLYRETLCLPFGILNIYRNSPDICRGVLANGIYKSLFSSRVYNVYMGYNFASVDETYRAQQMKKGIYLGHNIGSPCKLHIDRNNIFVYMEEKDGYEKVFWSFVLKYILTDAGLKASVLHLKGMLLQGPKGDLIILLGKGQSGKTTLGMRLKKYGYNVVSNTHCMVKKNYVWGINSWVRIRNNKSQTYISACNNCNIELDGYISRCYVVFPNYEGILKKYESIDDKEKYLYIKNFSAAISNYDLKEEVWDYMVSNEANDIKNRIYNFKLEEILVKEFCNLNIDFVSIDSNSEKCLDEFRCMIEEKK